MKWKLIICSETFLLKIFLLLKYFKSLILSFLIIFVFCLELHNIIQKAQTKKQIVIFFWRNFLYILLFAAFVFKTSSFYYSDPIVGLTFLIRQIAYQTNGERREWSLNKESRERGRKRIKTTKWNDFNEPFLDSNIIRITIFFQKSNFLPTRQFRVKNTLWKAFKISDKGYMIIYCCQ